MKNFLCFLIVTIAFSTSAWAGKIEPELQAVIMSSDYPKAAKEAKIAVLANNSGAVATMGKTSRSRTNGPDYFYYIPVYSVRVPLSSEQPKNVGNIVARLSVGLNSPLPEVLDVSFQPAQ